MKWFKHDTNSLRNPKIRKAVRTHGTTGYAIWFALLEKLYESEGDFQIHANSLWLEDLADDLKIIDYRTLIRVFDTFAEVGLISSQLWHGDHIIYCESIIERGDKYLEKRQKEAEKKRKQRANNSTSADLSPGDKMGTRGQMGDVPLSDIRLKNIDLDLEEEFNKHTANFCESEASQCVMNFDSDQVQPDVCDESPPPSEPLDKTEPERLPASSEAQEEQDTTKQSTRQGKSSAAKIKKSELMQRFDDQLWRRYPGTRSTGSKGAKSKAVEKLQALLKAGVPEEDIYAAFDWDLKRRRVKWDAGEFAESFPYLDRYLAQVNFKETLTLWRTSKANPGGVDSQDTRAAIGRILKERKLSGVLPDDWQDATGATLISELTEQQAFDFLNYLRQEVRCA